MKRGAFVIFSLIVLILISNVIAYQSTISVKTGLPNKEIIFKACDPNTGKTLPGGEFRQESDGVGKVVFDYNLEPILIKMSFMAWGNAGYSSFLNEKQAIFLNNVILDEFVDVDLNKMEPSFYAYSNKSKEVTQEEATAEVEIVNETNTTIPDTTTPNLTTETQTEEIPETQNTTSLTGSVISKGKNIFTSGKTYLILGGILVFVGIILFAGKIKKKVPFKTIKLSEIIGKKENRDDEIAHAEMKLKEVQEELESLKNKKGRIKEVQERLKRDKEELRRLGGKE